jgi:hypothetical protein
VNVTVDQLHGPVVRTVPDSGPSLVCSADVRAVATGTGQASWSDATIRLFGGIDGSVFFDSAVVSSQEVRSAWGKPEIAAGESQTARWSVFATIPFKAVVQHHYRIEQGGQGTAEFTVDCGPMVPAGTPAPSITALAVHQGAGDLEPGGTLSIDYAASSTVGLWQTAVTLSGPCEVQRFLADSLEKSVTRTVRIPLPAGCQLGVPITVTVTAKGAGLQTGTRALATGMMLVDTTPPRITPLFFPSDGGSATTELSGDFFAGDSIHLMFNAFDNHALRALVWEFLPAGVTDSLVVAETSTLSTMGIFIPSGVTGPVQLRLSARDAAGLTSNVVTSPATGSVLVHPTIERPTKWTTVSGEIRDVAIDTRRGLVYLMQSNQRRLAVLSLATMTVTETATMPDYPSHLDLSASGDSLILLLPVRAALGVIDLRQPSLQPSLVRLAGFDPTVDQSLAQMSVAANGKVFVTMRDAVSGGIVILEVDLATGGQRIRTDAGVDGAVGGGRIARSLDHSILVTSAGPAAGMQQYSAGTDSFGPPRQLHPGAFNLSVDATGRRTADGLNIYDDSLQFLRTVRYPGAPGGLPPTAISAAGDAVYEVFWPDGIVRASVDDGMLLDRTPNPIRADFMRVSDDGTLLVTVESEFGATSKLSVIDLR